ncbi:MAG: hypothetical protein ACR5K4_03825 [Sodalis sp. (in: enterobacteria)]
MTRIAAVTFIIRESKVGNSPRSFCRVLPLLTNAKKLAPGKGGQIALGNVNLYFGAERLQESLWQL